MSGYLLWEEKMIKSKLLSIGCVVMLFGCITAGKAFDTKNIPRIEKGKTTQKDILQWFGNPDRLGIDDGEITWSYLYLKLSLFSQPTAKDLTVRFDKNGVTSSYSFTTSEDELDLKADLKEEK
jgi:outer membrane protein assembly factor BamE (lipoprotein component of BamABCDE complex)